MRPAELADWHEVATTAERAALMPPPRIAGDEWCEQHLWLAGASVSRPGPFAFGLGRSYMREWIRSALDPTCRFMATQTSTQVGKTTAQMAAMCAVFVLDPSPLLFVAPRDADVRYMTTRRLRPIIEETPALRGLLTGKPRDFKQQEIELSNGMILYTAIGGSAASVKSKPCKRVLLDETNAYPHIVSKDEGASAILLAGERTRDWAGRELIWQASTPTVEGGAITQALETTDRRQYWVPCPHCGWWQLLVFDRLRLPQPKAPIASVVYRCESCEQPISDREKREAVDRGVWVQKEARMEQATGTVTGAFDSDRRGWSLPCWYAPKLEWAEIMAQWLRVQEAPEQRLQHWTNSWAGQPFKDRQSSVSETGVRSACGGYVRGDVPAGVLVVTGGVDAQKAGFHYVLRGWGLDGQSWLLDEGYVSDWKLLIRQTVYRRFTIRDQDGTKRELRVVKIACDSRGGREAEVYAAARQYGPTLIAVKGLESMTIPFRESALRHSVVKGAIGQRITWVHTNHYKGRIFGEIAKRQWHVFDDVPDEYVASMTAEELVRVRTSNGGFKERYEKRRQDLRNDKLDCEVYAMAAADVVDVGLLVRDGLAPDAAPDIAEPPESAPAAPSTTAHMFESDRRAASAARGESEDWVNARGGRTRW